MKVGGAPHGVPVPVVVGIHAEAERAVMVESSIEVAHGQDGRHARDAGHDIRGGGRRRTRRGGTRLVEAVDAAELHDLAVAHEDHLVHELGLIRRAEREHDAVGIRADLLDVEVETARDCVHVLDHLAAPDAARPARVVGEESFEGAQIPCRERDPESIGDLVGHGGLWTGHAHSSRPRCLVRVWQKSHSSRPSAERAPAAHFCTTTRLGLRKER